MRKFLPVPAPTTCRTCGTDVEATPEGETYSRQTLVTFDGSDVSATYCSNGCVNDDAQRLSDEAFPAEAALREVRRIKAPTKRAAAIAAALISLPTQKAVEEFTRQLRIDAGVQDVELLPRTMWDVLRTADLATQRPSSKVDTAVLRNTLADAEDIRISWPSVVSHWGVLVTFTWGGEKIVVRSADYQITETSMSM
jgi:hypothetical protein